MRKQIFFLIVFIFIYSGTFASLLIQENKAYSEVTVVCSDRNREIPVAVYGIYQEGAVPVLFSHGWDDLRGKSHLKYSYLCQALAEKGYYVVSVLHENKDDPMLAMEGNLAETRMPNWKAGVRNLEVAVSHFKKSFPGLSWDRLVLIGHSNGGDISLLYGSDYPCKVDKVITLDHLRMPIPRQGKPSFYTLRGCDYEADRGVLPDEQDQLKWGITVIALSGVGHSEMHDKGTPNQKQIIINYIFDFLAE